MNTIFRIISSAVLACFCAVVCLSQETASKPANWPMYKNGPSRQGFNPGEKTINKNNAQDLTLAWAGVMGDLVDESSPAIVNGVAYIGSFDGNLYAFDASGCGQSECSPLWSGA